MADIINGQDQDVYLKAVQSFGPILTVNGTWKGETATVTVDDASAAFSNILFCASDGHYDRAKADSSTTMPGSVLALQAGSGTKIVLKKGQICNTAWNWTPGLLIYVSPDTIGTFTQDPADFDTTGMEAQVVGFALSADTIWFDPNLMLVEIA